MQTSPQEHARAELVLPVALEHWHLTSTGTLQLQTFPQVQLVALQKSPVALEQWHSWVEKASQRQSEEHFLLVDREQQQDLAEHDGLLHDMVVQNNLTTKWNLNRYLTLKVADR